MDEDKLNQMVEEVKAKITPENVTRMVVKGIAKHSVAFIATRLAKTYVPTENKQQQLQVAIGTYVIAGMAGEAATNWAEQQFDEAVKFVKGIFGKAETSEIAEETPKLQAVPVE